MRISVQRIRYCGTGILIPVFFVASTLLNIYGFDSHWYGPEEDGSRFQNLAFAKLHDTRTLSLPLSPGERKALQEQSIIIDHGVDTLKELARKHRVLRRRLADASSPYRSPTLPRLLARGSRLARTQEVQPLPVPLAAPVNSPLPPSPSDAHAPLTIPTPPPQADCKCKDGYTSTPTGSPCGCVIPIQVGLELGVDLETFFPLVLELSKELADGSFLQQSQVRITGATTVANDQDRTDVHADLVPLGVAFDNTTAQLIAQRFWTRQVDINETLFGNYTILYVNYPGLPPSPPSRASGPDANGSASGGSPSGSNVPGKVEPNVGTRNKLTRGIIVIIALTSAAGTAVLIVVIWLVSIKCCRGDSNAVGDTFLPGAKKSGRSTLPSTIDSFTTLSYSSNFATYIASARNFSELEIQRATDNFKEENIVGEGGFGRVYQGRLDDGLMVAVKVLTREDDHEYLAEAELLSRLHHRNLVKLLGICIEGGVRALVYELISNGSVESHLHGVDKEAAPLNWDARIKIALGAARGLAYLHEDSNPRVIHRDFKASNILLEEDFTPKISDFGLAKVASEGGGEHISTRVMGTFGYVAPEYAMTGHLLVKSDVYSYGVVLLELLSGRKPVDMSQPPGEENLVRWARPLLSSKEGLDLLLDPVLRDSVPFENVVKVAAIASMCVQPEVSHRPFMGEVVQALKLVYNDSDASDGRISFNGSHVGVDVQSSGGHGTGEALGQQFTYRPSSMPAGPFSSGPTRSVESEPPPRPISASAILSSSSRFIRQLSGSFRRYGSSGPLRTTRSRPAWYRVRYPRGGTMSDHHNSKYEIELERDYSELWP